MTDSRRILIVDSRQERGEVLRRELDGEGYPSSHLRFPLNEAKLNPTEGALPKAWDLALIHVRDDKRLTALIEAEHLVIKRKIYYSGKGGADSEIPQDEKRIWKAMGGDGKLLTEMDCTELRMAAANIEYDPPILHPGVCLPLLRTIGILCVLYLAVRAAKTIGTKEVSEGENGSREDTAYRAMGWFSLPPKVRQRLCNERDALPSHVVVSSGEWWAKQINAAAGGEENVLPQVAIELAEAAARGLTAPKAIDELVRAVLKKGTPKSGEATAPPEFNSETVLAAYSSLKDLKEW